MHHDDIERMVKKIRESFSTMFKATQEFEALWDSASRWIIDATRPLVDLQETITSTLRSSQVIKTIEKLKAAFTQAVAFVKEYDRATGILVELGWPPHGDLYTSELAWIVEVYDSKGPQYAASIVDQFMVKRYGEKELHSILERWRQRRWLQSRLPVLEQIIEGHKQKLYYLSVPTCFAQIEGVIAEGFGHTGRMTYDYYKKYLYKLLDTRLSGEQAMQEFISKVVFANFVWGSQLSSDFSRHAILHGSDTRYGTAKNSLRSILLFDYIQGKFGYVSVDKEQSYHDPSCPIIRGKERRAIFESETEVVRAGMRPCSRCIGGRK